jgi:hypothetical protein
MSTAKSPGAVAAHGAFEIDQLGGTVVSKHNPHRNFTQAPNSVEREVVAYLQARSFAAAHIPLSGSAGGSFIGNITIPLHSRDLTVEVKARANGFRELYCWLIDRDLLIVRADRSDPLVVMAVTLALEVATAAEQANAFCHTAKIPAPVARVHDRSPKCEHLQKDPKNVK